MRLLLLINRCQANEPCPCRPSATSPGSMSSRPPSRSSYPTGAAAAWTSRSPGCSRTTVPRCCRCPLVQRRARARRPRGRRGTGCLRRHAGRPLNRRGRGDLPREWGDAPMGSADPTLQLRLLCMRPGGRGCSGRQGSPCTSRPRGSTGRTCGSPRAGAATTCTFLSDIAVNIASMDY